MLANGESENLSKRELKHFPSKSVFWIQENDDGDDRNDYNNEDDKRANKQEEDGETYTRKDETTMEW